MLHDDEAVYWDSVGHSEADMILVQNFTLPDFQAKNFTPQKCVIRDIFSRKLTT